MNISIIGTQWGDEGKGKIVDLLAETCDVVVRFQGGHNAGHTLVIDGVTYKLSLLPSGVVRGGKVSVIGNGVVIDPEHFIKEKAAIEEKGIKITPGNLFIAENCCLILPIHQERDKASEGKMGDKKIGTTGRGIGPAYEDKAGRRAIRICDLADQEYLKERVEALYSFHGAPQQAEAAYKRLLEIAPQILAFMKPVWKELEAFRKAGKKILFEGAQGTMLDVDHGTYPFVTSSNTIASNGITGCGLGYAESYKLGITKAYTTRVGSGPFPAELSCELGEHLGAKGHEFGTVTARKRRCGWFDAVLVRQSCVLNGISGIALMKLDVLDEMKTLKICTGYEINGVKYDYLPASPRLQEKIKPIYEEMPGWQSNTAGTRELSKLPEAAKKYIARIEELVGVKCALISTSPERNDSIVIEKLFK